MTFFAQRVEICARFVHGKPSVQPFLGGKPARAIAWQFFKFICWPTGYTDTNLSKQKKKKKLKEHSIPNL